MITALLSRRPPEKRGTIEDPNTPLSYPTEKTLTAFGVSKASSGVSVTPETAMNLSSVWRAVALISSDVAKLPLLVFRRTPDGKERATDHPLYQPLKHKPNPWMTSFSFRQTLQASALIRGNGYALIDRRNRQLMPLDAAKIEPVFTGDRVFYSFQIGPTKIELRGEDVLHIRGLGDGFRGHSVVSKARDSLGVGLAAMRYGGYFFGNSAEPGIVLEHPYELSPDAYDRLRRDWNAAHQGVDKSHLLGILEEGMKATKLTMSNEDSQFLETRQFEIREVANWFGVPPHKIGDTTRTAFASLEQENQKYLDESLDPWLVAWEQEVWDKLLTEDEKRQDEVFVEFVRQALARANMTDRGAYYNLGIMGGWLSRDEVRGLENLNNIPDGEGKKFFVPLNVGIAGEKKPEPEEEEEEADDEDETDDDDEPTPPRRAVSLRPVAADAARRVARRIREHATRQARKPDGFCDWLEEFDGWYRAFVRASFRPIADGVRHPDLADTIADRAVDSAKEQFELATYLKPKDFPHGVSKACGRIEALLVAVAEDLFGGCNG